MTRYFIGLMVPQGLREQLHAFAMSIDNALSTDQKSRPRWNDPSDLHCTLLFLGEYADEQYLVEQMQRVARQLPGVRLTAAGQTHWLGRNSLAVEAHGAEVAGTTFVEELGHLSSNSWAGRRPFYGHVTLGRVSPVPDPDNDEFSGHTLQPMTWVADHVQLVCSRDASVGPRYEVVAQAPFEA